MRPSKPTLRKASMLAALVFALSGLVTANRANALSLTGIFDLIYPPNSYPAFKSFPQLAAGYWKWMLLAPADKYPIADTTGASCGVNQNQNGLVWYLTTQLPTTPPVKRTCTIPSGRTLVFPLFSQVDIAAPGTMAPYNTEAFLRPNVNFDPASFTNVSITIDGVAVPNPNRYYEQSELFSFTVPQGSPSALQPGFYSAGVDAGLYYAVQPLLPGKHTLHIYGVHQTDNPISTYTIDVTYDLTISLLPF